MRKNEIIKSVEIIPGKSILSEISDINVEIRRDLAKDNNYPDIQYLVFEIYQRENAGGTTKITFNAVIRDEVKRFALNLLDLANEFDE